MNKLTVDEVIAKSSTPCFSDTVYITKSVCLKPS